MLSSRGEDADDKPHCVSVTHGLRFGFGHCYFVSDGELPLVCVTDSQIVRAFTRIIIEITLALTVLLNIAICICASSPSPFVSL